MTSSTVGQDGYFPAMLGSNPLQPWKDLVAICLLFECVGRMEADFILTVSKHD
jgi:hypothetical protein